MERILLKQDDQLLNEIINDFHEYQEVLSNTKESYEKLEIGKFSNEVYQNILKKGSNDFIQKFYENLNNQLDNAKIESSIIRSNMISQTQNIINEFKNSVIELKSFKPSYIKFSIIQRKKYLKLEHISFSNGRFTITTENKESILEEYCRTYLESERDHQLFELVSKFADSYKELKIFLTQNNYYKNPNYAKLSDFVNEQGFASGTPVNVNSVINMLRAPEFIKSMSQS